MYRACSIPSATSQTARVGRSDARVVIVAHEHAPLGVRILPITALTFSDLPTDRIRVYAAVQVISVRRKLHRAGPIPASAIFDRTVTRGFGSVVSVLCVICVRGTERSRLTPIGRPKNGRKTRVPHNIHTHAYSTFIPYILPERHPPKKPPLLPLSCAVVVIIINRSIPEHTYIHAQESRDFVLFAKARR